MRSVAGRIENRKIARAYADRFAACKRTPDFLSVREARRRKGDPFPRHRDGPALASNLAGSAMCFAPDSCTKNIEPRIFFDERADGAGVVEMNVREKNRVQILHAQIVQLQFPRAKFRAKRLGRDR